MINHKYEYAHQLCFMINDVMVDFLKTGEENDIFNSEIKLSDTEKQELLKYDGNILN